MKDLSKFTDDLAARLSRFLSAPERPEGTMSYCELAGFLFAVACSPELIPPSEWLPLVFNEKEGNFATPDEAQEFFSAVMALHNVVNAGVLDRAPKLPSGCTTLADPIANLEPGAPLSQWARGFAGGHDWLLNVWEEYLPDALDEELGADLLVLSFFASPELAEAYRAEIKLEDKSMESLAGEMIELLPVAMGSYANIGRSVYEAPQSAMDLDTPAPARSNKVGRNDLCPCGSGKKFKKCCVATLH
jgi:uncharacterized protein